MRYKITVHFDNWSNNKLIKLKTTFIAFLNWYSNIVQDAIWSILYVSCHSNLQTITFLIHIFSTFASYTDTVEPVSCGNYQIHCRKQQLQNANNRNQYSYVCAFYSFPRRLSFVALTVSFIEQRVTAEKCSVEHFITIWPASVSVFRTSCFPYT